MCIYIAQREEKKKKKRKRNNLDFSTFPIPTGDRRCRSSNVEVVVEKGPSVQDETDCWQEEISQAEKN